MNLDRLTEHLVEVNTDICLEAAQSSRLGTRLWAIDELAILEDARAKSIFEEAVKTEPEEIRWRAENGLKRLAEKANLVQKLSEK